MVLRDRMLFPVSIVTKEKKLQRQSGITGESFRNSVKPFCSVTLAALVLLRSCSREFHVGRLEVVP